MKCLLLGHSLILYINADQKNNEKSLHFNEILKFINPKEKKLILMKFEIDSVVIEEILELL